MRIPVIRVSCLVLALILFGLAASAVSNQSLPGKPPLLCSDIVSYLSVQKAGDGTVTLTGRVCNEGPGGYSNATGPLEAYFMIYTWYPPKSAGSGELKFFANTNLGTVLKAHDCKSISYVHKIANFSRWGSYPLSASERPAMKQFCVQVKKNGPLGFTACEDTNTTNTTKCLDVPYMEKIK